MKRNAFSMVTFLIISFFVDYVYADTIFQEDFNTVAGIVYGVPTISGTGADNDWYGARFAAAYDGTIASDIATSPPNTSLGVDSTNVRLKDDAGIIVPISTAGYENVSLSFDYRLYQSLSSQSLRVGYFVGDINGFSADRTIDLTSGVAGWSNWTTVYTGKFKSMPDITITKDLLDDEEDLWLGFWYYSGVNNSRYPFISNILLTGDALPSPAPEPGTVSLLGIGLLAFSGFLRKRK